MKTKLVVIFLLLVLVAPGMLTAEIPSEKSASVLSQVQTYDQLVAAIRKARAASQARVEQAVAQEKVRECWETGRLIDEHILQHKERADYGSKLLERLAVDLGTSRTELSYMLQFARAYPILRTSEELTWSHYESLLALNDDKERDEVAAEASKEKWPVDRLQEEVKKRKAAKNEVPVPAPVEEKLTAKLGKVGTYRMVKATVGPEVGKMVIDLGFSNYYRTSRPLGFKEGAIIEVLFAMPEGSSPSDKIKLSKRTADDLYTYRASIIEVLDGDTVNAVVDLGFGVRSVQTLRLRGIDAPEMVSKEGKEAKEALEKMLSLAESVEGGAVSSKEGAPATSILIRTVKSDKYDRYLADIFLDQRPQTADRGQKTADYLYLNQALVEKGLAVRVRDN